MVSLTTSFTEQVGIKYPIICGAMYPCTGPELVAAASKAGGIGIVQPMSLVYDKKLDYRESLRWIRKQTKNPYGVNIILAPGYEDRLKKWAEISLEEGCRFFITSLGKPTWLAEMVKPFGGIIYHDVINKYFAQKALEVDIHGLICVNNLAGGHLGKMSDEEMIQDLKDLGKPLICAGGVGGPKGFKRALELGYDGVQMGTRFIASTECSEKEDYKQAIVDSSAEDIVISDVTDGVPAAVIKTDIVQKLGLKASPLMNWLMNYRKTRKYVRAWYLYRTNRMSDKYKKESGSRLYWGAGRSVDEVTEIKSVSEIIKELVSAIK